MTIALSVFLAKVNNLLGDNISGTTDAAGSADFKTFVDSALSKYEDDYFGDPEKNTQWWAYVSSQLRTIKGFTSSSGTVAVHKAFSAQIPTSTAYQLHRFDRDQKIIACNQSLYDAYPYFYKSVEDSTTLDGKGASNNQYAVPATFTEFPDEIWSRHTATNLITDTPVTNFTTMELAGARYFYADITLADDIILIGKTYLTQFTNDASTTELTDGQANTVSLLAAAIFYRNLSGIVNATDSGRYDSLANRYEMMWDERKLRERMSLRAPRAIGWSDNE